MDRWSNYFGLRESSDAAVHIAAKNIIRARRIKFSILSLFLNIGWVSGFFGAYLAILKWWDPNKLNLEWAEIPIAAVLVGVAMVGFIYIMTIKKHVVSLDPKFDWAEEYWAVKGDP